MLLDHQNNGVEIKLTTEKALQWGPNTIEIESTGNPTNVELAVFLDTGAALLTSPIPVSKLESGQVVFVSAPEAVQGEWMIELSYSTSSGNFSIIQPVNVEPSIWVQHVADSPLYVSWVSTISPHAGTEQLEFAVHRFDGRVFLPVPDAILDLYPYMDMGAGDGHSAPYEAPVHAGNGRYRGSVNFIMSGGWDLTVMLGSDPSSRQSVVFKGFTVQ